MNIEQIYTGCLSQGAYYLESEGEAAIIDPLREVTPYLQRAAKDHATIKYVFETHFHADFVSGHVDLAQKTGATIVYGPEAQPAFKAHIGTDNEEFKIGKIFLKLLHTPGHTLESSCYLLLDENKAPKAIFTGDTLFLGDVGRPDLAQKAAHMSQEELAGLLYNSLIQKILALPDELTVYPGHGAGSACGKNMSKETVDTLGHQKKTNYALLQPNKGAFIKAITDGMEAPPAYFPSNVKMNKEGSEALEQVLQSSSKALEVSEFEQLARESRAIVLDARDADSFSKGFVPKSINIGLDGKFAPWVGALIAEVQQPIVLITAQGLEQETIIRLARVGFDHVLGYLKGGFEAWALAGRSVDTVQRITPQQFVQEIESSGDTIVDVRREAEFDAGHVNDALNRPLDFINEWTNTLDTSRHFYVHCGGGYRSMIAASILKARGIHNFSEVEGGYVAIAKERDGGN